MKRPVKWTLIAVGVLAGLIAAAGLIGAMLPREVTTTASVTIAKPPEVVWEALANHENLPLWFPEFEKVEVVKGSNPQRWQGRAGSASATYEDIVREPPKRLVSRTVAPTSEGLQGEWEFRIEPAAEGSRLTADIKMELGNPFLRFVVRLMVSSHEAGVLEQFKKWVESR